MSGISYPVDSVVIFEGEEWKVISRYFELRKLQLIGQEVYRTVTVEELDAQQPSDMSVAGDEPQS